MPEWPNGQGRGTCGLVPARVRTSAPAFHKNTKMAKPTGPTNPLLIGLIEELKKKSVDQKANLWRKVASDLERPTRKRRIVNLSKIDNYTKENETIVVPGKVLGAGNLNHKLTISAYQFSNSAKDKLIKAGAKIIPLNELIRESPKGKRIRIIG